MLLGPFVFIFEAGFGGKKPRRTYDVVWAHTAQPQQSCAICLHCHRFVIVARHSAILTLSIMSHFITQTRPAIIVYLLAVSGLAAVGFGFWTFSVTQSVVQALLAALLLACVVLVSCVGLLLALRTFRGENQKIPADIGQSETAATQAADKREGAIRFAKAAADATLHPIVVLDTSGRIVITNVAAQSRFSLGAAQTTFSNVVRRPDLLNAISTVIANKEPITLAMETRVPVDRYERASIAAFDVDGVTYVMVSIFDDTEVRMSDRMRADFLANASHELRTPLAAIIGFIETLRGPARKDEEARDKFLAVMHTQADRMRRLISDLLSLSRIELNEHVAPKGASDIAAAVYEAADLLPAHSKKRLEIDAPNQPIHVIGDRDEMAQVVINLIDNALKYSAVDSKVIVKLRDGLPRDKATDFAMRQWSQGARLSLTTPDMEAGRLYGVLRVENSGEGIERQHLPRLSERFFRIEDTASGKGGTGLGLAIVKHIVSRHRGGLNVESVVGEGAAFGVYLPQPPVVESRLDISAPIQKPVSVTKVS